ncbi:hypothetical protein JAAARDRAFT_194214 [Jaapia argillacea MUCL 33604]|uniref:Uncharacterized protein n=1 Tax=Jaapia argillacea MUCL 33604 TaxID=933084 RepID=A0A067PT51_9AGAM|nr:hypothetical protein JAAARDRAFT_194214 [Jaapia argillacea MUCL 33604]
MPAARRSTRNRRGSGWHRKGYRDNGDMWINVKRACHLRPFVRGHDVNENSTLEEFLTAVVRDVGAEDGFPVPESWEVDIQRRGKSLWIEPLDAPITDYFDGGETVTVKVFDDQGDQKLFEDMQWIYK